MSKKSLIESIEIKNPCSEDWDRMTGSDRARFCRHCSMSVNNLSALTRKQALRLVSRAEGRICVRYVKDPVDNSPVFADRLYKITRRASLAAGVLGATLAVSTLAYAQGKPVLTNAETELTQTNGVVKNKSESSTTSIAGVVTDALGAVLPNARVMLIDLQNKRERASAADAEGFYRFENVEAGKYKLVFQFERGDVFKPATKEIEAVAGRENTVDAALDPTEMMITVGELAVVRYSSPLFEAVAGGDVEAARNLLARGAGVNERDENYGRITPLFVAVENGSAEIAETLLNFGARVNARDRLRQTPLMRLDEDAPVELVNLLIRHGARVNLVDRAGNTPLLLAARAVNADVLRVLIYHSANVDARNGEGRTALMEAADSDNLENVRALLLAGADVNLTDNDGEPALELTTDPEIKELLTEFGAKVKPEKN